MRAQYSWGYKLDYAKEIANDLREIAQAERHVPLAAVLTEQERAKGAWHLDVLWFLLADIPGRMALVGVTAEEVRLLVWLLDFDGYDAELKHLGVDPDERPAGGWYGRATAVATRLQEQFDTCVIRDPQPLLKKLRARLARHRRNQGKFG